MNTYQDTSFLCAMYRFQENSTIAASYFSSMKDALLVASPLLYEFRQSMRWQVYLNQQNPLKGFPHETAQAALAMLNSNISQKILVLAPIEWAEVVSIADGLSVKYTRKTGYRAFDILHVATSLHLGAKTFLTFDKKQKELAKSEGLRVPRELSMGELN